MTYVVFCLLQKTKLLFGPARRDKKYFFISPGRAGSKKYFLSRLVSLSSNLAGYKEFEDDLRMGFKKQQRQKSVFDREKSKLFGHDESGQGGTTSRQMINLTILVSYRYTQAVSCRACILFILYFFVLQ